MQMGEFEFILPLTAKIKKFHYLHVSFWALGLVRTVKCCAEAHQQGTVTQEIGGNRPRQTNQRRQQRAQNLCRHIWAAEELNAGWLELAGALLSVSVHALSSELDTNGASVKTNLGPPEHLVTTLPQHTAGKKAQTGFCESSRLVFSLSTRELYVLKTGGTSWRGTPTQLQSWCHTLHFELCRKMVCQGGLGKVKDKYGQAPHALTIRICQVLLPYFFCGWVKGISGKH